MHLLQAGLCTTYMLFCQTLWVWLPSLTQHPHCSWQGKGKISWLSMLGFLSPEYCYFFVFISLDNSAEHFHLTTRFAFLFGVLLVSSPYFSLLLCALERWEGRSQNGLISSKGQFGERVGLQAWSQSLTNVRDSSRPFQPGRLHTIFSAPGEDMSWNIAHHLLSCFQITCPVNALSASKYCAIKSGSTGLTCNESLALRKH